MTEDEFWEGLPILAKIYKHKYELQIEKQNEFAWLQGMYVYEAVGVALSNAFAKKGSKIAKYPEQPFRLGTQKEAVPEENKNAQIVNNIRAQLDAISKKAMGGKKNGS